jgi:hypothetical protein
MNLKNYLSESFELKKIFSAMKITLEKSLIRKKFFPKTFSIYHFPF